MSASWPQRGWRTDEARTNELPIQMYWVAPPMSWVMAGRAVVMIMVSRAEMKARRLRLTIMAQNRGEWPLVLGWAADGSMVGSVMGSGEVGGSDGGARGRSNSTFTDFAMMNGARCSEARKE